MLPGGQWPRVVQWPGSTPGALTFQEVQWLSIAIGSTAIAQTPVALVEPAVSELPGKCVRVFDEVRVRRQNARWSWGAPLLQRILSGDWPAGSRSVAR
jgi:hypothetical protein